MKKRLALVAMALLATGCPVPFDSPTPVDYSTRSVPATGESYRIYVPSYYSTGRSWPMVVLMHGTKPFDTSARQIKTWDTLAEDNGFIVVAPMLTSPQGVLPVIRSLWYSQLARDERAILAVMDDVCAKYAVDRQAVLLTGFSAGGFPLYYVGLRNPQRFNMLIAASCNSDIGLFEQIELTDAARNLPIMIYWGKDDPLPIQKQSWSAFRYLRNRRFLRTNREEIKGGHRRTHNQTYNFWREHLPAKHQRQN